VGLCVTALNPNLPVSIPISEQWEEEEVKKYGQWLPALQRRVFFFTFAL
jgi:hypothetical protein